MKILAFAASSSQKSLNKELVKYSARILKDTCDDVEIQIIDLNDFEMPIYSIDRENEDGIHPRAQKFYDLIGEADALIVSYAEHNGIYTAAFKNIFDWASRIDMKVFQNKPMVIYSASLGPAGGASVLKLATESAPFYAADIRASVPFGSFYQNFDIETGKVTNAKLELELNAALDILKDV